MGYAARSRSRAGSASATPAPGLRVLGEIASRRSPGKSEDAEQHYGEAQALAADLGMRPLVARGHLGLGECYQRADTRQRSRAHLTTAAAMFRELGMTYWTEKADVIARMRPLQGPADGASRGRRGTGVRRDR